MALLLGLLIECAPTFAVTTLCVTNAAQLQSALDDVSDGGMFAGSDATIMVVQGQYLTSAKSPPNQAFYYSSTANQAINIIGGYQGTCPNPTPRFKATSILDGGAQSPVLEIHSAIGMVQVEFLTIQNGHGGGVTAGLSINSHVGDNSGALVKNNIIKNNSTGGLFGGMFVASGGTALLQVQSNLILNNHADNGYGAGAIVGNGGSMGLYANTIYGNTVTASGETAGLTVSSTGGGSILNNIVWNNSNSGLKLAAGSFVLSYNDIGSLSGVSPISVTGDVSVSPKFTNAAGGDFHLAQDSPLLALSSLRPAQIDLDGFAYPEHGKIDIGAYEETIFVDGVDGN